MMTTHELAAHWLVRTLGWTLLHFCWQGVVIALVLWCALQLLAGRPAQQRYAVACIALGLMIFLPLATFSEIGIREYRLAAEFKSAALPDDPALVLQADLGNAASWLNSMAAALDPYLPWVLMAWCCGLMVSLARLSFALYLARRMKSAAVSSASQSLQAMCVSLRRRLDISRPVRLMYSAMVQVPTVVGWLRPAILIPVGCFTGLTEMQMEAILSHELAHIRRHDYLVNVVQSVVEAVLFYHPAVWWVSQQMRRERECCCDDLAVEVGGNALAYARALSTLESRRGSYPEIVLGSNGGVLTMRIKRLLQCEEVSAGPQMAAIVVLVLLTAGVGAIARTARAEGRPVPSVASEAPLPTSQPAAVLPPKPETLGVNAAAKRRPSAKPAAALLAEMKPAAVSSEAPQQAGPAKVAGGVMAGQIISKVNPVYPAEAKAACVQGTVVIHAMIAKTGSVENLQVISGPPELYSATLDAVRQWIYKPYLLNGEPTEVDTTITVNYNMTSCPAPPQQGQDAPRTVGGSVSAPVLISSTSPGYSEEARAEKISGVVVVRFWVDEQGTTSHVQVVRGLGHGLDAQAIEAVRAYRFKPALENGRPVVVALNAQVRFEMF